MANKMLIDASHPEETRVVVLRGNRVEEFDFESAQRKQLRGNIYLAKVTRVEPSLQAAFVDYGGNRHGFLAFSEIHPDYYQIPVADRQALIEEEERAQRAADAEADHRAGRRRGRHNRPARHRRDTVRSDALAAEEQSGDAAEKTAGDVTPDDMAAAEAPVPFTEGVGTETLAAEAAPSAEADRPAEEPLPQPAEPTVEPAPETASEPPAEAASVEAGGETAGFAGAEATTADAESDAHATASDSENGDSGNGDEAESDEDTVESVGGSDALEEAQERVFRPRRQYKIQEVIKRRQVMLVQVVKEERGTKGAALTTYLSLAGRYSVLMPNTARGGGISRKITSADDRKRLKEIAQDLEVPEGMGVILRTAGASRTKTEVKRDFEYLLRLWETVRDLTLKSTAPKLTYEEGSLVKRAIRDLYNKDIDDVVVAGDEAYKDAKDFMRMLMPSHAKNVKLYKDNQPIFTRYGIESQLDAMFSPIVQLRSGGYIVLNQAEALVAIDVNSGRATREHHIEDTALKTNVEAAEEVARQLRLRDLAGLIVIDFIDMDEKRNNRTVERKLKECLKHDRARIQVGRISHFGLLEMSRQRIRSSVLESSTEKCPECGGSGHVRSVSSVSLQLLRALEEALIKAATHNLIVRTRGEVALYVLNHKRAHLRALEERFRLTITINADATVTGQQSYLIDRGEQVHTPEAAKALVVQPDSIAEEEEPEAEEAEAEPIEAMPEAEGVEEAPRGSEESEEAGRRRRRRRRRRRGGEAPEGGYEAGAPGAQPAFGAEGEEGPEAEGESEAEAERQFGPAPANGGSGEAELRRRRRGRRGRRGQRGPRREGDGDYGNGNGVSADAEIEREPVSAAVPPLPQAPVTSFAVEPTFTDPVSPMPREEPAAPAPVAEPAPEPPRRRSTVREPAPIFGAVGAEPAAMPAAPVPVAPPPAVEAAAEPQPTPAEAEETKPRRTGWWAKRLMGKG